MKKMFLLLHAALLASTAALATTVVFKPGPAVGEDAMIWLLDGNCIPLGFTVPAADLNLGNSPEVNFARWTWNDANCGQGTTRQLIRFTELSTIPSTATIISAEIRLNGPTPTSNWGNNYYPGTPLPNTNEGWVKRVNPGLNNPSSSDNWSEGTVTWNTQPSVDPNPANWAPIGVTNARWGYLQQIDVTSMVQQIVSESATDAYANNGFLLQLQTEVYYRQQCYAASDASDSTLWPELVVTYTNCNPNFTYCSNTNTPYSYDFTAEDPGQSYYDWIVDGSYAGSGLSFHYDFPGPGSYKVCLKTGNDEGGCDKCILLCIDKNEVKKQAAARPQPGHTGSVIQGRVSPGDDPTMVLKNNTAKITPNPAKDGWNIAFRSDSKTEVKVALYDLTGRELFSATQSVEQGNNVIYQAAGKLSAGTYFVEVKGNGISIREKVVKN